MAAIDLTVTIPDDAALQQRIVEAIEWTNRDEEGTPADMTPAQVKAYLRRYMRKKLERLIKGIEQEKARAQTSAITLIDED